MTALPLAIIAGGLATRLRPITQTIPKSMVPVAGEPFIAHQLRLVHRWGFRRVVLCIGHLGEQIQDFVGDGGAFDLEVVYSFDGDRQLGTGGAICRCLPLLGPAFAVTYGDSYLDIEVAPVRADFLTCGLPALMTVMHNRNAGDKSNVHFDGRKVLVHDKKSNDPTLEFIDYGLSFFTAAVFTQQPVGAALELASVTGQLAASGQLAGHLVRQRFYEIGSHQGLIETEAYLSRKFDRAADGRPGGER